jgi:hypothetical protein
MKVKMSHYITFLEPAFSHVDGDKELLKQFDQDFHGMTYV